MKKLNQLTYDERKELSELLEAWLGCYVEEVIEKVMGQLEEIINNPMTMMMLRELKKRMEEEKKKRIDSFYWMVLDASEDEEFDEHCVHNHCMQHSKSYRDVLYDIYIA